MPPEELETRMQAVSVLRRYSQAIGDLAVGKQAQTALREPLAGAGGPPTTGRTGCERQDDPTANGPHPVWTRRCAQTLPRPQGYLYVSDTQNNCVRLHLFDALWCRTHRAKIEKLMHAITLHLFDALWCQ